MSEILTRRKHTRPAASRRVAHYASPGASIGLHAGSTDDLIRAVRRGLPYKAIVVFASETGFAPSSIASVIEIPERTLARRKAAGHFAPEESERLLRISAVFEKAVELFEGDVTAAAGWLTSPKKALGNQSPLAYSRFDLGAREVENLIGRIEHGVFT